jgi:hypothetical protein
MSDVDLQLFILHGLGSDYDSIVVSFTSRSEAIPFNEFSGLLLIHEQRLNKHALAIASSSPPFFPTAISTATSVFSGTPQAHLVSSQPGMPFNPSFILGPLSSQNNNILS